MDSLQIVRDVELEIVEDSELYAICNDKGEVHRSVIMRRELGQCRVRGELKAIHYANNEPEGALALVIFEFGFVSSPRVRFKAAKIRIAFDVSTTTTDNPSSTKVPEVDDLFPRQVYGAATDVNQQWSWDTSFGVETPDIVPINANIAVTRSHQMSFTEQQRMEIHGHKDSNKYNSRPNNVAEWRMCENKFQKDGIPHQFTCAAVVRHECAIFQADVSVNVVVGAHKWYDAVTAVQAYSMQAWPWRSDDPVRFNSESVPESMKLADSETINLRALTENQKQSLTPLVEKYKNDWSDPSPRVQVKREGVV